MFGRKACGCGGFGRKNHSKDNVTKKAVRAASPGRQGPRHLTVNKATGAGDMGPGRDALLGNTYSGLANGQRDIIDYGNAQTAMQKRKEGPSNIESRKKNKAQ